MHLCTCTTGVVIVWETVAIAGRNFYSSQGIAADVRAAGIVLDTRACWTIDQLPASRGDSHSVSRLGSNPSTVLVENS